MPLTDRQADVLRFIREFIETHGKPPTVREIQRYFGYRSPDSAAAHLAALERKGVISRVPGESRNIQLSDKCTDKGELAPMIE